jgi:hypothetical protein
MTPDVPDRTGCEMCEQVDKALIMAHLMRNEAIPVSLFADYNHWAMMLSRPRLVQHAAGPLTSGVRRERH